MPSARATARTRPSATSIAGHLDAAAHVDAVAGVDGGDRRAHLRAEGAHQRRRQALEHDDRAAAAARRGGHLEADEPGADDDHPGTVDQLGAQAQRVVERAQDVDPGGLGLARAGGAARRRWR